MTVFRNFSISSKTTRLDLAQFLSLRILTIDDMSMLGTTELSVIDQRLRFVSGCDVAPFGGLGVILIGDFTQLQPVKDTALFTQTGNNLG